MKRSALRLAAALGGALLLASCTLSFPYKRQTIDIEGDYKRVNVADGIDKDEALAIARHYLVHDEKSKNAENVDPASGKVEVREEYGEFHRPCYVVGFRYRGGRWWDPGDWHVFVDMMNGQVVYSCSAGHLK